MKLVPAASSHETSLLAVVSDNRTARPASRIQDTLITRRSVCIKFEPVQLELALHTVPYIYEIPPHFLRCCSRREREIQQHDALYIHTRFAQLRTR